MREQSAHAAYAVPRWTASERRTGRSLACLWSADDPRELALHQRDDGEPDAVADQPRGHRRKESAPQHVSDARRRSDHGDGVSLHAPAQVDGPGDAVRLRGARVLECARLLDGLLCMPHGARLLLVSRIDGHCSLLGAGYRETILPTT